MQIIQTENFISIRSRQQSDFNLSKKFFKRRVIRKSRENDDYVQFKRFEGIVIFSAPIQDRYLKFLVKILLSNENLFYNYFVHLLFG